MSYNLSNILITKSFSRRAKSSRLSHKNLAKFWGLWFQSSRWERQAGSVYWQGRRGITCGSGRPAWRRQNRGNQRRKHRAVESQGGGAKDQRSTERSEVVGRRSGSRAILQRPQHRRLAQHVQRRLHYVSGLKTRWVQRALISSKSLVLCDSHCLLLLRNLVAVLMQFIHHLIWRLII